MTKLVNILIVVLCLWAFFSSCGEITTNPSVSKYVPKTDQSKATVELIRFEKDFFEIDTNNVAQGLAALHQKYPDFMPSYLEVVLNAPDSMRAIMAAHGYLRFPDARITLDKINKEITDFSQVQKQLNELATHYNYYNFWNGMPITKAYTLLAEYSFDRAPGEGYIALPLDMALGEGYSPYTVLKIPQYMQRTLTLEHLVPKAANGIAQNLAMELVQMKSNYMIDFMLAEGKKFYIADILLPTVADSLKFGFSAKQMEICTRTESELYEHLAEGELLYSDNTELFSKYISPGPFNPEIALPGNSGSWIGYRMVLSYADFQRKALRQANPKKTMQEIDREVLKMVLDEKDPQKFLQLYKPRK